MKSRRVEKLSTTFLQAAFTVDEQGYDAEEESAQENLLQKFVDYVKVGSRSLKPF